MNNFPQCVRRGWKRNKPKEGKRIQLCSRDQGTHHTVGTAALKDEFTMCAKNKHILARGDNKGQQPGPALVTEGHLSQESGGMTCMVGHGINSRKMKLFQSIYTLCSLQTEVVLPKAKEAYDLGPGRGLAISAHCHMFL